MPTVTGLHAGPGGRIAVELDGVPWRTLPGEPVVRAGLAVGGELDRPAARRLRRELRRAEALGVAARSLRTRDLSSRRLAERLETAAIAPAARSEAVGALTGAGIVDDARFARNRARALAERGYGNGAIAADLERQAIPADLRAEAIAELEPEAERAGRIVRRRGTGTRTARFLAQKGFDQEIVEGALRSGASEDLGFARDQEADSDGRAG